MRSNADKIRKIILLFVFFAIPVTGFAADVVHVRYADHPTFSRMVFDWQERVPYMSVLKGNRLEITFDKALIPDWGNLKNNPLHFMALPIYRIEGEKLIVTMQVTTPSHLHHFRSDTKIVIDIIGDKAGDVTAQKRDVADKNKPITPVAAQPIIGQTNIIVPHELGDDHMPRTVSSHVSNDPAPDRNILKVTVSSRGDYIRINYPWSRDVPAAAFIYQNHLWVVFEGKKVVDQTNLQKFYGQRISSARQIDHPTMTILMYDVAAGQGIKMHKTNSHWSLDMGNTATAPDNLIPKNNMTMAHKKGEGFFFSIQNIGSITLVEDPDIGINLAVVPVMRSSQGVSPAQKFAEFTVLQTAQGIAVQLTADDLNVLKYNNGVIVSEKNGLALSRGKFSGKLGEDRDNGGQLIDFSSWKKGPLKEGDYHDNKHQLLFLLSNATDDDRSELRWTLAKFYLANRRVREAFGVLTVMLEGDPELINNPDFRAVLAVTNILMNRFKKGVDLLDSKDFLAERQVFLWNTVAYNELGKYKQAFENYKLGSDILFQQSPEDQIRFLSAAIRSAYKLGNKEFVKLGLPFLRTLPLNTAQLTEVDYWQALLSRDEGDILHAEEILHNVVKSGVRKMAAWAQRDLIDMDLASKKIDTEKAIDQLEKLRFAWRGDDFELELLSRLGDLYVEQKDFNKGLQTLKLAVTFFKASKKTSELTRQMSRIYEDLFLRGGASVMDPIKAVALYSDFRELIPLGKDGDDMTRRLADRLVSLDLLEEAAKLLDHQIKFRLKGGARAVVASRLAMIYLLDSKPKKAMKILRATRQLQIPEDVERLRNRIETRALIQMGHFEEAEVMLEGFHDVEAEKLRSDIYWKSENWVKYIAHETHLLNKRYQDKKALSKEERLAVLRLSVAYVINGDKAGVKALRNNYKTHMDNGPYSDTFDVITAEWQLKDINIHRLTKSIASITKLESFMESYKAEFSSEVDSDAASAEARQQTANK